MLINNYEETSSNLKIISDIISVIVLTISIIVIDKKIKEFVMELIVIVTIGFFIGTIIYIGVNSGKTEV